MKVQAPRSARWLSQGGRAVVARSAFAGVGRRLVVSGGGGGRWLRGGWCWSVVGGGAVVGVDVDVDAAVVVAAVVVVVVVVVVVANVAVDVVVAVAHVFSFYGLRISRIQICVGLTSSSNVFLASATRARDSLSLYLSFLSALL